MNDAIHVLDRHRTSPLLHAGRALAGLSSPCVGAENLSVLLCLATCASEQADSMGAYSRLETCYAGKPGDVRERHFVEHLKHTSPQSTRSTSGSEPPKVQLPPAYAKSTLLIAAVADHSQHCSKLDRL